MAPWSASANSASAISDRLEICQRDWKYVRETRNMSERLKMCQRNWKYVRETENMSERLEICQRD